MPTKRSGVHQNGGTPCRRRGRSRDEAELLAAAFEFFDTRGPYESTAALLEGVADVPASLLGRAHCARGYLLYRAGSLGEAAAALEQALVVGRGAGDDAVVARSQQMLVGLRLMLGHESMETAVELAEEALGRARRSGDGYVLAQCLNGLGMVAATVPDPERARGLYAEATDMASRVGDRRNAAMFTCNLVAVSLALRRPAEAAARARLAVEAVRSIGDRSSEAVALGMLAMAHAGSGEHDAARETTALQLEAMRDWRDETLLAEALTVLAAGAAARGAEDEAIRLWAAAERARGSDEVLISPELRPLVEDVLDPLRSRPGFSELWGEGSTLGLDKALEQGLGDMPS
jgi:tetratricopeptide (TPR) repeat protein